MLRNGRLVAARAARGATKGELAELMVGRAVVMPTRERRATGATVVAIDGVRARDDRGNCAARWRRSYRRGRRNRRHRRRCGQRPAGACGTAFGSARAGRGYGNPRGTCVAGDAARVDRRGSGADSGGSPRGRRDRRSRRLGERRLGAAPHAGVHARRIRSPRGEPGACAGTGAAFRRARLRHRRPGAIAVGRQHAEADPGPRIVGRRRRDAGAHRGRPADLGARHRSGRRMCTSACSTRRARARRSC